MTRQQLLSNASIKVVNPERREDTFPTIAKLWSAYLAKPISESDVCALMILLKAARLSAGHSSADSLVDIAGYAACAVEYVYPKPDPLAEAKKAYNVRNGIVTAYSSAKEVN